MKKTKKEYEEREEEEKDSKKIVTLCSKCNLIYKIFPLFKIIGVLRYRKQRKTLSLDQTTETIPITATVLKRVNMKAVVMMQTKGISTVGGVETNNKRSKKNVDLKFILNSLHNFTYF